MKYLVKVRQVVISEVTIEVEAASVIQAMDEAETFASLAPGRSSTASKWAVASVSEIKDEPG